MIPHEYPVKNTKLAEISTEAINEIDEKKVQEINKLQKKEVSKKRFILE